MNTDLLPALWPPPAAAGPHDIEILDVTHGAAIRFPFDRPRIERLKVAFRRIHWQRALRCWYLKGVKAARRLEAWRVEEYAKHGFDRWAVAKKRDDVEFSRPRPPPLPVPPMTQCWCPTTQTFYEGRRMTVDEWIGVLSSLTKRTEARSVREMLAQEKASAAAEPRTRAMLLRADAEEVSDLFPIDEVPQIGELVVKDGRRAVYVALGRVVTITPRHVGRYGPELLLHVGQKGRFMQWEIETS